MPTKKQMAFLEKMKEELLAQGDSLEDIQPSIDVLMKTPTGEIQSFRGSVEYHQEQYTLKEAKRLTSSKKEMNRLLEEWDNDDSMGDRLFEAGLKEAGKALGISYSAAYFLYHGGDEYPDASK